MWGADWVDRYLWPGYDEDASNYHVLLLALLVNVKQREGLPAWGTKPITFTYPGLFTD